MIIRNRIYNNTWYGIYSSASDNADYNIIASNEIYGASQKYGIYWFDCDNTKIRLNTITNNSLTGIYFTGSATVITMLMERVFLATLPTKQETKPATAVRLKWGMMQEAVGDSSRAEPGARQNFNSTILDICAQPMKYGNGHGLVTGTQKVIKFPEILALI